MKSWSETIYYLLLLQYCQVGINLVQKYLFPDGASAISFGLVTVAVCMSAYPIFGWGRMSPWPWLGRWSVRKWGAFAVGLGALAVAAAIFSEMVANHFSGR